jgi:hypothetical protein
MMHKHKCTHCERAYSCTEPCPPGVAYRICGPCNDKAKWSLANSMFPRYDR